MPIIFDSTVPRQPDSLGFSQNSLIREVEGRDDDSLPVALRDNNTKIYLFCNDAILVRGEREVTFSLTDAEQLGADLTGAVLLGHSDDGPCIAAVVRVDKDALPSSLRLVGLRQLVFASDVPVGYLGEIAQGRSILHWHSVNQFCGACGAKNESRLAGYRRDCPSCNLQSFPRTDPAVIMLSIKGDKCLLGRNRQFPPGLYSTLAGFVEPGETIEDAVRRETFEESGITVGQVNYFTSQPWPFPHSVMIGAHCEALSEEIVVNTQEMHDCRWFTRDEIEMMYDGKHPDGLRCPPLQAISSALIREWVDG